MVAQVVTGKGATHTQRKDSLNHKDVSVRTHSSFSFSSAADCTRTG